LQWKLWALDQADNRFSGIMYFEDDAAMQAFLTGDLAATVTGHPALSDFRITPYTVMGAETMITRGPITPTQPGSTSASEGEARETAGDAGVLLRVNFHYNVPAQDFVAAVSPLAPDFAAAEGLRWKIWALNQETSQFSGLLLFDDQAALQAFLASDLAHTVTGHPALSDFAITAFDLMAAETRITRGPVRAAAVAAR
jgi:hypothetical protein